MGEIVTASVSSREDHGYIMDIGSNTIRGFVPAKTMSKVRIMITMTISDNIFLNSVWRAGGWSGVVVHHHEDRGRCEDTLPCGLQSMDSNLVYTLSTQSVSWHKGNNQSSKFYGT